MILPGHQTEDYAVHAQAKGQSLLDAMCFAWGVALVAISRSETDGAAFARLGGSTIILVMVSMVASELAFNAKLRELSRDVGSADHVVAARALSIWIVVVTLINRVSVCVAMASVALYVGRLA